MAFEFLGEGPGGRVSANATSHRGRMVTEIFTTEAVRSSVFQVVERSVLELPQLLINGGRRGYLLGLAPAVLVELLGARAVDCAI